ncbi:hypothetical protein [Larkinella terrae]|uniref:Uncharacterized protein n=1 Tax=Larkinella terrae TaxID=2025311 RepID=A0A7K0EJ81_9BACT|nr:hypothetical protein [Larkinella terrae]MRS61792.1 hypothetical protein [Larkinella terrae]
MKRANLITHRENLISQLNLELSLHNRTGKLSPTASTLLGRIQRVNERLVNREATTINGIIQKQDDLAKRVFESNESSDQLLDEINAVGQMLQRRADSYIVYEQQPNYIDYV